MTTRVVHYSDTWLAKTKTWMFNQVRYLPDEIEPIIVCRKTENIDLFGMDDLHCLADSPFTTKLKEKIGRNLRKVVGHPRHSPFLVRVAKERGAQILHSHFGNAGWADISAAKLANLKHVVTFYGYDVNMLPSVDPKWTMRYKRLFRNVDLVLCEGSHMAASIVDLGCPSHKVRVQHLGVDLDAITYQPRQWNKNEGPLRMLIAGTFTEKKGIPYALRAISRVRNEIPVDVTIIGDSTSNPQSIQEKANIFKTLKEEHLESVSTSLGYVTQDRLWQEAYKHHIFLSPSVTAQNGDTEGGAPVSIIEMAASGMPIISTTHCDIPEVVLDKTTGFLSEERDVDGLVKNIRQLSKHPEGWKAMLDAGRSHIETNYCAKKQGRRLKEHYLEILN